VRYLTGEGDYARLAVEFSIVEPFLCISNRTIIIPKGRLSYLQAVQRICRARGQV
jgi:hypothetical protein